MRNYLGTLRQVLDFADLDPNPARDRRVKLPRREQNIPNPPSAAEVATIVEKRSAALAAGDPCPRVDGHEIGELVGLEWGDVDRAHLRRIRNGKTSAVRRWILVPEWLMEEIEATCPPDDRTALRRVFPGAGRQTIGNAVRNACKAAGIANYSPHDLRHRFISLKIREGVPVTQVAASATAASR